MAFSITDEQDYPRITPAVQWLIAINVAIYFLQATLYQGLGDWFAYKPHDLFEHPWTIVTYMFVHAGFWHVALNMYTLWLFGPRVEHAWGSRSFAFYYVLCGLGGWLLHLMLAQHGVLLGASGAVFGVMIAYAMRWPDDELYLFGVLPLKVKWLIVLLVGIDLASGFAGMTAAGIETDGVAHFAHLGGIMTGWLYLRYLRTAPGGGIDRLRQRMSQLPDVPDEVPRAIPRTQPRPRERERGGEIDEIVARSNAMAAKRPTTATVIPAKIGKQKAEALNDVLDKISEHGIDSLTGDERHLLEEMSQRLRNS